MQTTCFLCKWYSEKLAQRQIKVGWEIFELQIPFFSTENAWRVPPGHQNGENFHFHAWLEGKLPEILKYEDAELPNSTIRINAFNDFAFNSCVICCELKTRTTQCRFVFSALLVEISKLKKFSCWLLLLTAQKGELCIFTTDYCTEGWTKLLKQRTKCDNMHNWNFMVLIGCSCDLKHLFRITFDDASISTADQWCVTAQSDCRITKTRLIIYQHELKVKVRLSHPLHPLPKRVAGRHTWQIDQ